MAKIEVFSSENCVYCETAKMLLVEHGLAFQEFNIAEDPASLAELRRRLPRTKSIPQIFVDGDHIGGLEDLQRYLSSP
ncbi:MAG: glutaredoxin family protein [Geminicoccaceae bacterium]